MLRVNSEMVFVSISYKGNYDSRLQVVHGVGWRVGGSSRVRDQTAWFHSSGVSL